MSGAFAHLLLSSPLLLPPTHTYTHTHNHTHIHTEASGHLFLPTHVFLLLKKGESLTEVGMLLGKSGSPLRKTTSE